MAENTHKQHSQAFRLSTWNEIVYINTRLDKSTGQYVILWRDVQMLFHNPRYIMNERSLVHFMTDDNFEDLEPLRISYQPGIILDVVTEAVDQSAEILVPKSAEISVPKLASPSTPCNAIPPQIKDPVQNPQLVLSGPASTPTTDTQNLNPPTMQLSTFSPHGEMIHTLEFQTAIIKNALGGRIECLQAEMETNKMLQTRVLQQQEQMLQLQQQALLRMALIQDRVQAVLTQTYELHEGPVPRLFIVLPMASRRRDKLLEPFSQQFRLYFLCECGTHTISKPTRIFHEFHLAKHEGYDLDRPKEFFEKYGSYVLTLLQMIKYGFTVAGIVVPPLALFKSVEGLTSTKENFGAQVDNAISFIEDLQQNNNSGVDTTGGQANMDKLEVLEGADLRQLELYLKVQDQDRCLGNLYRIVTAEGHVKWVCIDHYRANYRATALRQLRDIVELNLGNFIPKKGRIEISIRSRTLARQFYEAMVKTPGVQELEIGLQWDATLADLRTLAAAVSKTAIVRLSISGEKFHGPALDFVNRGRRFDPIVELMSNGRIQSLRLANFKDFYQHISPSSIRNAPQLRTLAIDSFISNDPALEKILRSCSSMIDLRLSCDDQYLIFDSIESNINQLPQLETITLECKQQIVTIFANHGRIQDTVMAMTRLEDLTPGQLQFIKNGRLTKVSVKHSSSKSMEDRLASILCQNPMLSEMRVTCHAERTLAIVKLVTTTRTDLLLQKGSCTLGRLEVIDDGTHVENHTRIDDTVNMTACFPDSSSPTCNVSTSIEMQASAVVTKSSYLFTVCDQYSWSIERLRTNHVFSDDLAMLLDNGTKTKGSS
ncbi:hypothetical protein BGZ54_003904, partial [Gamsiella multidivaricata]